MRICNPYKQSQNRAKLRIDLRIPTDNPTPQTEQPSHCICAAEGLLICQTLGLGCAISDNPIFDSVDFIEHPKIING
jgi:hypothetical protein